MYKDTVAGMARLGATLAALDAQPWLRTLNVVLRDINVRACAFWRRVKFCTALDASGNGLRYLRVDPGGLASGSTVTGDVMSIIRAAVSPSSATVYTGGGLWANYASSARPLMVKRGQQFSGVGHLSALDGPTRMPNCIWLDFDPGLGWQLIGLDPRPDQVYWIHAAFQYRMPWYGNPELPLMILPQVEPVLLEGMLAKLTEGSTDFHRKSFHEEHLILYNRGVTDLRRLAERAAIAGSTTQVRLGRGSAQRDWSN